MSSVLGSTAEDQEEKSAANGSNTQSAFVLSTHVHSQAESTPENFSILA